MTKATAAAGKLPAGSIDFDKVHANARAGKDNIYEGAVSHQRGAAAAAPAPAAPAPAPAAAPKAEPDER